MAETFLKKMLKSSSAKLYLYTFLAIYLGCIIISNRGMGVDFIHNIMYLCILTAVLIAVVKSFSSDISEENILRLIIFIGCVLRIGYTFYNGPFSRTHDTGAYDDLNGNSKATYLMWIFERGKLPEDYSGQLYHQPFSYFMSALSCKMIQPFLRNADIYFVASVGGKLSSCFASCGVLFMTPRLGKLILKKEKTILILTWLVAVFPGFLYAAGRLGEDAWCCFFMLAEILYSIYWSKKRDVKSTVILALFYGLGLQTSISCVLPFLFTVYLVVLELLKEKELWKKYLYQAGIFSIIMVPLGLWFYVRNLVKFHIPLTYINQQIPGGINWTGDIPLWKRYLPIDVVNIINSPFAQPYDDYNLPTFFLKSELFGEFTLDINPFIPYVLLFLNIIITIISIATMVFILCRSKSGRLCKGLAAFALFLSAFNAYSYYKEPFGCSMDARYFLILTILKIVFYACFYDQIVVGTASPAGTKVRKYMGLISIVFGACSIVMFCHIR